MHSGNGSAERTQFPYELRGALGAGPIGRVFAARLSNADEPVALKMIHRGLYEERARLQALKRAYDAVAQLNTPDVAPLRGLSKGQEAPYIVMPRDNGESVASVWARSENHRPCPPPIALDYITQIARGLDALHNAGVVHGDLKPSNIRLRHALAPAQPIQFALSDAIFADLVTTRQLVRLHADVAIYAAPEQFDGVVGPQADQYALAVFAWTWLVGEAPFAPRSISSVIEQKRSIDQTVERRHNTLDAKTLAVLHRALHPEPGARFPSVMEFRDALAAALERRLSAAMADGVEEPPPTITRRHLMIGGLAAVGTVALIGVTGRWLGGLADKLKAPVGAGAQPAVALPLAFRHESDLGGPTNQMNAVDWAPASPLLAAASDDHNVYIWDTSNSQNAGAQLIGHKDFVTDVAWDPSGQKIVSSSYDETARIWDPRQGKTLRILRGHTGIVYGVAWYPDGTKLVTGGADSSLRVWDARTGAQLSIFRPQGLSAAIRVIRLSPDGGTLAAGDLNGVICLLRADTGDMIDAPIETGQKVLALTFSPDNHVLASGAIDGQVRLWNALTAAPLMTFPAQPGFTRALSWAPDQDQIVAGYEDGSVVVWHSRGPAAMRGMFHVFGAARAVHWNTDATLLAVGTAHRTVELWRPL